MARVKNTLLILAALSAGTYLAFNNQTSTPAGAASSGGTITGRVVLVGNAPTTKLVKVTKDNEKCGAEVAVEDLIGGVNEGIQNTVVSVADLRRVGCWC